MAAAWARGLVLTALLGLPIPGTSAAQTPWLPTTGPEGGTADLFLQDPVVPGVVYARSQICNECPGRVYRSADGGESWQATSLPEPMELLFVGKDAVYAAGGTRSAIDEDSRAPALQTLFVSRDGGVTWTSSAVLPTEINAGYLLGLVTADPAVPGTLYAPLDRRFVSQRAPAVDEVGYLSRSRLAMSRDHGRTWQPQSAGWPGEKLYWVAADPYVAGAFYGLDQISGGMLSLWRLEGTFSWDRLSYLPALRSDSRALRSERFVGVSVDPARPSTLYYLTSHRLLKSTDGGRNWLATGLPEVPIDALPLPGVLYSGLSEDPRTGTLVALRDRAAPRVSRDGGESWDDLTLPGITLTPRNQVTALGTAPNGASLISVSQLGIWKLDAGATTWRPVNRGFNHAEVVAVAVNPTDARKLVVAVAHPTVSIYRSADAGRSWEPAASGMPDLKDPQSILLSASAASPGVFYVSSQWSYWDEGRGWLLRSPDGGANWFPVLSECQSLSHVVDHPALPGVAYVRCTNGLYRSNDAGLTWALVSNAGGTQGNEYQSFLSPLLLMDRDTPTTLYAIAPAVCAGCDLTVWKSTDGGLTFSEVGVPGWSVRSVAQGADGVLYVPSYKSLDKGLSWIPTCANAEGCVPPSDLVADPVRAGTLYSNDGRYWSRDGSERWEAFLAHGRQSLGPHAAVPSADGSVLYMPRPFGGLQAVSLASMAECRYSLSPSSIDVGGEGNRTGIPVQVATQPHCPWACQSDVDSFADCLYPESNRSSWQGSASLLIQVQSNWSPESAPPRTMTMMVAGNPLTIRQAAYPSPDTCKYRLVPKDSYVDRHGRVRLLAHAQSATASIETGASCEWTIRSDRPWLAITSATSGTGPSTVSFSVTANPRRSNREGTLRTNGVSCVSGLGTACLGIAQMAPGFPEIVVQPATQTVVEGQFATFSVETRGEGPLEYEWFLWSFDGWEPVSSFFPGIGRSPTLTLPSSQFADRQRFLLRVQNPVGYLSSESVELRIDNGSGESRCTPVLAAHDAIVALDGGHATLRIGVGSGCRWELTGAPDWISPSQTVGDQATEVALAVSTNLGGKPREAVLQVGAQRFRVRQEGTDCPVELSGPGFSRVIRPHDALTVLADRLCAWDVTTSNPWLRVDSIMTITDEGGPPYRDPHWSAPHGGTRGAGSGRITFVFDPLPPVVDNQTGRLGWVKVGRAEIGAEQFPLVPIFTGFASPYLGRLRCEILPNQARPDLWLQGFSNAASTGSFQVHQSCYDSALAGHPLASRPWTASSDVSWVNMASGEVHDNGTSLVGFTIEADPSATACRRGRVLVAGWPVNVSQGCGATAPGTPLVEVP